MKLTDEITDIRATIVAMQRMLDSVHPQTNEADLAYEKAVKKRNVNVVQEDGQVIATPGATSTNGKSMVRTTETTIRHYLGSPPASVFATPFSGVMVWISKKADESAIYLKASADTLVSWKAEV